MVSARGVQIGNIGREQAQWLAPHIDLGNHCAAVILDGGETSRGLFGVTLLVSLDASEPPDVAKFERDREDFFD